MSLTDSITWHNDGHVMLLELNRAEVRVLYLSCPEQGPCQHPTLGCVVRYFMQRFGLECNVGVAPPTPEMTIAWSLVGDFTDVDASQVWVIPTTDDAFAAWLVTQSAEPGDETPEA
jgi:hypothetical protein